MKTAIEFGSKEALAVLKKDRTFANKRQIIMDKYGVDTDDPDMVLELLRKKEWLKNAIDEAQETILGLESKLINAENEFLAVQDALKKLGVVAP